MAISGRRELPPRLAAGVAGVTMRASLRAVLKTG